MLANKYQNIDNKIGNKKLNFSNSLRRIRMKLHQQLAPVSTIVQYDKFKSLESVKSAIIHKFEGVDGCDVYNPSIPFELNGITYMAGRVEDRGSEKSKVMFFREENGNWLLCQDAMVFDLQDPFITWIDDEIILGGVRVDWDEETGMAKAWYTDFYRGTNLNNLKYFASGPKHMKDVRLIQLKDRRIGIFSRPQGIEVLKKYGCIAKVGFTVVDSLRDVTPENIEEAPFLEELFLPEEWGGCNQVHLLKDGTLGVIGHKAYGEGDDNNKILHYYGIAFIIDPYTRKMSEPSIIISRDCFPAGPAKAPRLSDITFTAGIVRGKDNTAVVYTGLSDAQIGSAIIDDPFFEWEHRTEIML